jgi:hypothetical protein
VPIMKNIPTKVAAAVLILAGSIIPAFGQGRGQDRGGDRGGSFRQSGGGQRSYQPQPQQQNQQQQYQRGNGGGVYRSQQQPRQQYSGGGNYQRQQYQQQQQQYQPQQQYQAQPRYQENRQGGYRGSSYQQNYRRGGYDNRGYENRGYDNRRYDNRGYDDRRFESQRWSQRGGYRGYYIPENRFYSSFGRDHYFRIGRPSYYDGYQRFNYGGYYFSAADPFPEYWGPNWYDSDDVYVDYEDDGYYLYNRRYPGAGISVNIGF